MNCFSPSPSLPSRDFVLLDFILFLPSCRLSSKFFQLLSPTPLSPVLTCLLVPKLYHPLRPIKECQWRLCCSLDCSLPWSLYVVRSFFLTYWVAILYPVFSQIRPFFLRPLFENFSISPRRSFVIVRPAFVPGRESYNQSYRSSCENFSFPLSAELEFFCWIYPCAWWTLFLILLHFSPDLFLRPPFQSIFPFNVSDYLDLVVFCFFFFFFFFLFFFCFFFFFFFGCFVSTLFHTHPAFFPFSLSMFFSLSYFSFPPYLDVNSLRLPYLSHLLTILPC